MNPPPHDDSKWSKASLRIFSQTLTAEEITDRLQLTPSRSHTKGLQKSSRVQISWKEHLWLLECPLGDESDLTRHLRWLLDKVETKADVLSNLSGDCRLDFFCGFASENGQGGFTLDPTTLARLAALKIPVSLNLHPPGPIDEVDDGQNGVANRTTGFCS